MMIHVYLVYPSKCKINLFFLFLKVYLTHTNSYGGIFVSYLGRLPSEISDCDEENVWVVGDFIWAPGAERFNHAQSMFSDHSVKFFDVDQLPPGSYSLINYVSLT